MAKRAVFKRAVFKSVRMLCGSTILMPFALYGEVGAAAEVDQFTDRAQQLSDALEPLNRETNRRLQKAVDSANKASRVLSYRQHFKTGRPVYKKRIGRTYCSERHLRRALENTVAGTLVGQLERFAEQASSIERQSVPFSASIYQDFEFEETPSIAGSERISSVIRLNGVLVGTDKLGHFFTEGLAYYDTLNESQLNWEDAHDLGRFMESTYFGAVVTGVFSFADLVANDNGARFWQVFFEGGDERRRAQLPAVVCENERWVLLGEFDWSVYVDTAWDEAINCVMFRNDQLMAKVKKRLNGQRCPLSELPRNVRDKYQQVSYQVLNLQGHQVLPERLNPHAIIEKYVLKKSRISRFRQWIVRKLQTYYKAWEESLIKEPVESWD